METIFLEKSVSIRVVSLLLQHLPNYQKYSFFSLIYFCLAMGIERSNGRETLDQKIDKTCIWFAMDAHRKIGVPLFLAIYRICLLKLALHFP